MSKENIKRFPSLRNNIKLHAGIFMHSGNYFLALSGIKDKDSIDWEDVIISEAHKKQ